MESTPPLSCDSTVFSTQHQYHGPKWLLKIWPGKTNKQQQQKANKQTKKQRGKDPGPKKISQKLHTISVHSLRISTYITTNNNRGWKLVFKNYLFNWKAERRNSYRNRSFMGWFTAEMAAKVKSGSGEKVGAGNFSQGSHKGGKDPSIWAIIHCLPLQKMGVRSGAARTWTNVTNIA